nr:MAG TPA: hypothetical protein [Caudoviricetes sp.]
MVLDSIIIHMYLFLIHNTVSNTSPMRISYRSTDSMVRVL